MTTEDRIKQDANSFAERYWISDYLLEPTFIELMIQERNKTIDEVKDLFEPMFAISPTKDNVVYIMGQIQEAYNAIETLKVTPKS